MIFRKKTKEHEDKYIPEKIKNELLLTFKEKGIMISDIDICTKSGSLNVSLSIKEK